MERKSKRKVGYSTAQAVTNELQKAFEACYEERYRDGLECLHRLLDWLTPDVIKTLEPEIKQMERILEAKEKVTFKKMSELYSKISMKLHEEGYFITAKEGGDIS